MLEYLNSVPNEFQQGINKAILNCDYDRPLPEFIIECFESLNILSDNYCLIRAEINDDPNYINDSEYNKRRDRKKVKNIKFIDSSNVGSVDLWIRLTGQLDNSTEIGSCTIHKQILYPLENEGVIHLNGKDSHLIYQLVDKTQYNSQNSVTIKSLMPICVKAVATTLLDVNEVSYPIIVYTVQIFKKLLNPLTLYYIYGISYVLGFLEVDHVIFVHPETFDNYRDDCLYFKVTDIVVEVYKPAFEEFQYVSAIVGMLVDIIQVNQANYDDLENENFWAICLGKDVEIKVPKGRRSIKPGKDKRALLSKENTARNIQKIDGKKSQQIFHQRLLDVTTQRELHIDENNKASIYHLIRWVMQNFNDLIAKDNLSLQNKRLRRNEMVASTLTEALSSKLTKVTVKDGGATLDEFIKMMQFSRTILIGNINSKGILRYDESNNDMTFSSSMKYTKKGPNSLGNKNSRNVGTKQRDLHPSMLGYVDIAACGSSDPGLWSKSCMIFIKVEMKVSL